MNDDVERDVFVAVLAGLGALAMLSLGVLAGGFGLLLMAPSWQRATPVAVAVATMAPAADTPTLAPTTTPVLVALPVVAGPADTPAIVPSDTPTVAPSDTPTPMFTVTPEPTPTQLPTLTPTALPTVAPAPAAPDRDLVALRAWAQQVLTPFSDLTNAIQAAGVLLQSPNIGVPQWRQDLVVQMAIVQGSHTRLLAVSPPADAAPLHGTLTAATQHCNDAMVRLAQGLDHADVSALQEVQSLMMACAAGIRSANEQASAFAATLGGN